MTTNKCVGCDGKGMVQTKVCTCLGEPHAQNCGQQQCLDCDGTGVHSPQIYYPPTFGKTLRDKQ